MIVDKFMMTSTKSVELERNRSCTTMDRTINSGQLFGLNGIAGSSYKL